MASLDDLRIDPNDRLAAPSRRRWPLLLGLLLLAGALGAFFLFKPAAAVEVRTAVVQAAPAATATASTLLNASGYVTARRMATVSSKVTGKVTEVRIEEGMKVEAGQVLALLDDSLLRRQLELDRARQRTAETALREVEVRLELARTTLRRTRELVDSQIAAQSQLDADAAAVDALEAELATARDNVAVAQRQLSLTQQQIDDSVIRAPFAGVAISKDAQPGEMISPVSAGGGFTRTGIGTIVDMASLEIEVDVNEAYINRVFTGQKVEAVLNSYPDWKIPAHVITTIPTADRQKATVKVRIGFDEMDARVLPDMGVKVSFLAEEPAGGAAVAPAARLRVPRAALREKDGRQVVFVVQGNTVEERAVTIGVGVNDPADVLAGLSRDEEVVLEPPPTLVDGQRIKVKQGEQG